MKYSILKIRFSILAACCLLFVACPAGAARLYLSPQTQTIYQEETFLVEVRIDTEEEEINAAEVHLSFSETLIKVVDFIKGDSILSLWVQEPGAGAKKASFAGGVPGGFKGEGLLAKIAFQATKDKQQETGVATVTFEEEDCRVLLNDGKGTPAQLTFAGGDYQIIEKPEELPIITSQSHPDQDKWYKENTLQLYWDLEEGAEYSWILSYNPTAEPDEIPDEPEPKEGVAFWMGAMEYAGLGDGIYYFHLKQKLPDQDWSKKVTFRAMIDSTPPEDFEPQVGQDPTVFEGKHFLSFVTQDKTSGVDRYEVSEEAQKSILENFIAKFFEKEKVLKNWRRAESPYLLEDQSLQSIISVKAIDKAGNERIAEIIPPYKITWKDIVPLIILVVIILGVAWWLWRRIHQKPLIPRKINE